MNSGCRGVFLEIASPLGPWDRHDVWPPRQDPCKGNLTERAALGRCDLRHRVQEWQISIEVFLLKPRMGMTKVRSGQIAWVLDGTREKAPSKRTIGDETDLQFPNMGQDPVFDIS